MGIFRFNEEQLGKIKKPRWSNVPIGVIIYADFSCASSLT